MLTLVTVVKKYHLAYFLNHYVLMIEDENLIDRQPNLRSKRRGGRYYRSRPLQ